MMTPDEFIKKIEIDDSGKASLIMLDGELYQIVSLGEKEISLQHIYLDSLSLNRSISYVQALKAYNRGNFVQAKVVQSVNSPEDS